ncbi:MAG TPA: hypothetical protein VGH80_03040 [Xanthomonadaceae bacterium]|jgi:hypothetical protein
MSLFKSQMFIEDASFAGPDFDRDGDAFGPSYGNRLASRRQFREPWQSLSRELPAPVADDGSDSTDA